jgi:hypothetical protein
MGNILSDKKLILASGSDKYYLNKIERYLQSIEINSNFDLNVLVYIEDDISEIIFKKNWNDSAWLIVFISLKSIVFKAYSFFKLILFRLKYKKVIISKLAKKKIQSNNPNNCLQHGEFLTSDFFTYINEDDVIIFTDGDIFLQRSLYDEEIDFLKKIVDGEVFVGYNDGPDDTLGKEHKRLSPTGLNFFGNFENFKCYNTGVLCMNKKTWIELSNKYTGNYNLVDKMFGHYAKQQWLISYLLKDFNVKEMNYEIHNHNIYGIKPGMEVKDGLVFYNKKISLFRHKWF